MQDEWVIFGGGPSIASYQDQIESFVEGRVVVGTNWMPELVVPKYHVISNKNNYKRYRKNIKPESIGVGASKIRKLEIYVEAENEYPAEVGYFRLEDGKVKMAGGTVGAYAMALAVLKRAKAIYMVGFDGFRSKENTHWYRTEPNWKRAMWQQKCMHGILQGVNDIVPVKILTPTVYEEYYAGFTGSV